LIARARTIRPGEYERVSERVEHITLDGDAEIGATPTEQPDRTILHGYAFASRPDGCIVELAILEGHHLGVSRVRPGSGPCRFQFDLRFANPRPVRVRRLAWAWLIVASSLAGFAGGELASVWSAGGSALSPGMIHGALAVVFSIIALYVAYMRTTESIELRSAHGNATLVSVTGCVGSSRHCKQVFVELIRNIIAARLARPQPQPQFLRDEMREHFRLHQLGILSDQEYDASKARILAAHRPAK
jgi:hypothetical protein